MRLAGLRVVFILLAAAGAAPHAAAQEPVVEVPRRTETGEAPADPGARSANTGSIQATSNAERRDASPVECSGTLTAGCRPARRIGGGRKQSAAAPPALNTPKKCRAAVTSAERPAGRQASAARRTR